MQQSMGKQVNDVHIIRMNAQGFITYKEQICNFIEMTNQLVVFLTEIQHHRQAVTSIIVYLKDHIKYKVHKIEIVGNCMCLAVLAGLCAIHLGETMHFF